MCTRYKRCSYWLFLFFRTVLFLYKIVKKVKNRKMGHPLNVYIENYLKIYIGMCVCVSML